MFSSIRHGLFAALAGFTLLICICYTGLALVIAYVTEDMVVERLLQREAAAMTAHYRSHGAPSPPASDLVRAYDHPDALPPLVREQVGAGRRHAEIFTGTGQHYHLRTLDLAPGSGQRRLYLVADVAPLLVVSKLIQDVGGVLIGVALGLIGLALLLAYLLSRRLVLPLQELANEVRKLKPGGAIAVAARRRRDEIGYLAQKLDATLTDLQAALAREHAFTRDVGHELRTPLTVMRNTLVRAPGQPLSSQEMAQLRTGIDEIGATIDVLFALARAGHVARDTFDLRGCIEESLLRLLEDGGFDGERLALALPERLEVSGNRHLCTLLINNCLGNALFHGGPDTQLRIAFAHGVLSLSNTVDPGRTATVQGFRHGQDLLLRIAQAMEWALRFDAADRSYQVHITPRLTP